MKHLIWIIVLATLSCKVVHYYPIEIRKIPLKYYMDSDSTDEEWIRRKYIPSEEYPVLYFLQILNNKVGFQTNTIKYKKYFIRKML